MAERRQVGKPLLENLFGENNSIKVLDFFVMGKDFDFTLTQIHNGTGLSRTAIRNALEKLKKVQLIEQSRADKKSAYYRINKKSDKFKLIEQLYRKVMVDVINN